MTTIEGALKAVDPELCARAESVHGTLKHKLRVFAANIFLTIRFCGLIIEIGRQSNR